MLHLLQVASFSAYLIRISFTIITKNCEVEINLKKFQNIKTLMTVIVTNMTSFYISDNIFTEKKNI